MGGDGGRMTHVSAYKKYKIAGDTCRHSVHKLSYLPRTCVVMPNPRYEVVHHKASEYSIERCEGNHWKSMVDTHIHATT